MSNLPFTHFQKIGWKAQKKMAPTYRLTPPTKAQILSKNPKQAAVLCLWFLKNGEWHFPLIERTPSEGVHSGQISFPGGKYEKEDGNLKITALRETNEEIGTQLNYKTNVYDLSDLYIPPSNFLVNPFMTYVDHDLEFKKDPTEVADILLISQSEFLNAPIKECTRNGQKVPYFDLQNQIVWGATAMILSEVKEIISISLQHKQTEPK